jgi:urease accessory protein
MTDASALYRLMAWLSPAYPVGAFSYSHGIEYAVEMGHLRDAATTIAWLDDVIRFGAGRNDAIFCACAHRAAGRGDRDALAEVTGFAEAFSTTAELALETDAQGAAFLKATRAAWPTSALDLLPEGCAYPVAVGTAAAGHGIGLDDTLVAYVHAFAANLVSAAVRLVPLGQTDGQRVTAALESAILATAAEAASLGLEDAGSATLMTDFCSMKHETQYTRLFRS